MRSGSTLRCRFWRGGSKLRKRRWELVGLAWLSWWDWRDVALSQLTPPAFSAFLGASRVSAQGMGGGGWCAARPLRALYSAAGRCRRLAFSGCRAIYSGCPPASHCLSGWRPPDLPHTGWLHEVSDPPLRHVPEDGRRERDAEPLSWGPLCTCSAQIPCV